MDDFVRMIERSKNFDRFYYGLGVVSSSMVLGFGIWANSKIPSLCSAEDLRLGARGCVVVGLMMVLVNLIVIMCTEFCRGQKKGLNTLMLLLIAVLNFTAFGFCVTVTSNVGTKGITDKNGNRSECLEKDDREGLKTWFGVIAFATFVQGFFALVIIGLKLKSEMDKGKAFPRKREKAFPRMRSPVRTVDMTDEEVAEAGRQFIKGAKKGKNWKKMEEEKKLMDEAVEAEKKNQEWQKKAAQRWKEQSRKEKRENVQKEQGVGFELFNPLGTPSGDAFAHIPNPGQYVKRNKQTGVHATPFSSGGGGDASDYMSQYVSNPPPGGPKRFKARKTGLKRKTVNF